MKLILERSIAGQTGTEQLAQKLYRDFLQSEENFTIFLEGGLGAGKTFFIRSLLRQCGVGEEIGSPTYVYVNDYEATSGNDELPVRQAQGRRMTNGESNSSSSSSLSLRADGEIQKQKDARRFAHFDFYRLPTPQEFYARGFEELAEDRAVCKLVEWPEKLHPEMRNIFSGKKFTVKIAHGVGASMRKIKLLSHD